MFKCLLNSVFIPIISFDRSNSSESWTGLQVRSHLPDEKSEAQKDQTTYFKLKTQVSHILIQCSFWFGTLVITSGKMLLWEKRVSCSLLQKDLYDYINNTLRQSCQSSETILSCRAATLHSSRGHHLSDHIANGAP